MTNSMIMTLTASEMKTIQEAMSSYKNIERAKTVLNKWALEVVEPTNNFHLKEEDTMTCFLEGNKVRVVPIILDGDKEVLAMDLTTGKEVNFFSLMQMWEEDETSERLGVEVFTPNTSFRFYIYREECGFSVRNGENVQREYFWAENCFVWEGTKQDIYNWLKEEIWTF